MDIKELRSKKPELLKKELAEAREQLRDLRFRVSQNQHKDVRDVRSLKKDIARIGTVLKEKEKNVLPKKS